ncbi:leucyl-tRNA synthetase [Pseudomonas endophytica]|uniref:Leucyl-tRNA synthetase n=1 Tax=Pseudomonas endophytica TaxID=1563157 RepID=A0A0N8VTB6_9PSED|nr:hypothetical protein [Pseudomonas endophytica]KQB55668.1 leucyl-tRNA synthetase [Pseudomonas endophytica]
MSTGKEQLDVEDFPTTDQDDTEIADRPVEVAKTNLAKRRSVDALLAEKRLRKELEDYPYDL